MEVHVASLSRHDRVLICTIVRGEILYGLERMPRGRHQRESERKARDLFKTMECEPISEAAADHYARIKREAERQGTVVAENDLWIAATAFALGATLVTSDKDFNRIRGLDIEDWTD